MTSVVPAKSTVTLPAGVLMVSVMASPSRLMRTEPVPVTVRPLTPSKAALPLATAANFFVSVLTTTPSFPSVTLTPRSLVPTCAVTPEAAMVSLSLLLAMEKPPVTVANWLTVAVTVPAKTAAASVAPNLTATDSPLGNVMVLSTAAPVVLTRAERSPVRVSPSTPTIEAVPVALMA